MVDVKRRWGGFVTRQETAEDREAARHAAAEILCHGRGSGCFLVRGLACDP
jgi:hypothetical protein